MNMTVWARRSRLIREMWMWRVIGAWSASGTVAALSVEWWPVVAFNSACLFGCLRYHRIAREQLNRLRWKTGGMDR